MIGVLFVCEERSWGGKVIERDTQEREIRGGERGEFLDESTVARLQQERARG